MRIAIASGKGGTGKTLIATSLAVHWAKQGKAVTYVDADVEEPNGHLFLRPTFEKTTRHTVPVPRLAGFCDGCAKCQDACAFNAIIALKERVQVFDELCHSCGACVNACPHNSLKLQPRELGDLRHGMAKNINFIDGLLDVGEARATPLIEGVVEAADGELVIIDSPPGASCPAVTAIRGADIAVLITEPTLFGVHDLDLAVQVCQKLNVPPIIVLNRANLGGDMMDAIKATGAPLVAQIDFNPQISVATARGELAIDVVPGFADAIANIADAIVVSEVVS